MITTELTVQVGKGGERGGGGGGDGVGLWWRRGSESSDLDCILALNTFLL